MEEAEGPELTVEALTIRMLAVNFVAIHVGLHVVSLYSTLISADRRLLQYALHFLW